MESVSSDPPRPAAANGLLFRVRLAGWCRPLTSRLPRGATFVYRHLLGPEGSTFRGDPALKAAHLRRREVFLDRRLGAYFSADLTNWAERAHCCSGAYHDRVVPQLIAAWLRDGGTFIDVGANRGVHALWAARVLGEKGRVFAFEANPATFEMLMAHLAINGVDNCTAWDLGLSDEEGVLELHLFEGGHPGTCSFILGNRAVERVVRVPTRPMSALMGPEDLRGPTLVKIDTEGFDFKVIRGMGRLMDHEPLALYTEVTDSWLREAGGSADLLFAHLRDRGFRAFLPEPYFANLVQERVRLQPLAGPIAGKFQYDVFFCRRLDRVADLISPPARGDERTEAAPSR